MRPFVTLNQVQSLDGALTRADGRSIGLGSAADRVMMDLLRAQADLVLTGAATVRADDPWLHLRTQAARAYRQTHRADAPPHPAAAILTRSGPWPAGARCLRQPDGVSAEALPAVYRVQVGAAANPAQPGAQAPDGLPGARRQRHLQVPEGAGGLQTLLDTLYTQGIEHVVLEGGPRLRAAFLAADLIDEVWLTIAPYLLGTPTHPAPPPARRLTLLEHARLGDELFVRFAVQQDVRAQQLPANRLAELIAIAHAAS